MLAALEASLGVVSSACHEAKIPRATYYKWIKEDKDFRQKVEDINNLALDFVETSLHRQIAKDNRGYIERSELDISSKDEPIKIDIKIDGVDH